MRTMCAGLARLRNQILNTEEFYQIHDTLCEVMGIHGEFKFHENGSGLYIHHTLT